MLETFGLLMDIRLNSVFIQFPGVYPRTAWAEFPEQYGFSLDVRDYSRQVMNYKLKTLFPPSFWAPLPYKLNSMSFRQFARVTERLCPKARAEWPGDAAHGRYRHGKLCPGYRTKGTKGADRQSDVDRRLGSDGWSGRGF